ncbi:MAG: hypothetical protein HLUCCO16_09150 [Phormidium sp. OSCR]|nr:MAG: hypothetical protein HLUCCO16_09150 [Phormidium sp. OSCR]
MNTEELIALIDTAFEGVPQPQDLTLHVAEAHDDYDYGNDEEYRRLDYRGRWQDVPNEHIKACQSALSYLDKVGMRFYLPAFMVWYLRYFRTEEVWSDNTLYSLGTYGQNPGLAEYQKQRFSLFTPQQMRACAQFVKFCAKDTTGFSDDYFAQTIYDGYWSQFDTPE